MSTYLQIHSVSTHRNTLAYSAQKYCLRIYVLEMDVLQKFHAIKLSASENGHFWLENIYIEYLRQITCDV